MDLLWLLAAIASAFIAGGFMGCVCLALYLIVSLWRELWK